MALAQHGEEDLLDIGQEILGVDRPVAHERCSQPFAGAAARNVVVSSSPFGASPTARGLTPAEA
ncbi:MULTISPECIES: hypothetical protein [Bradyrhizobium]|uniref:Uncharacterized protein n=1 Tax=Bradyrhizobium yuanmingense TaxID=108015 RepID=A0ABV4GMA0_9BRAD|nr:MULTISPECIES: hypothetical protein [Bradyrhizobium]MCA1378839.1 hypothetical protein [Bradyrhizobium sp. IC4060]MCA1488323.1 hypothetical protein [Bradyrhizobium sp. IC4061]